MRSGNRWEGNRERILSSFPSQICLGENLQSAKKPLIPLNYLQRLIRQPSYLVVDAGLWAPGRYALPLLIVIMPRTRNMSATRGFKLSN